MRSNRPTRTHRCTNLAGLPDHVGGKINKEIEESRHKWGPTLLSLTIHFPIRKRDMGAQWSPSIFTLGQNGSRHQQQYSFTLRLSHRNKDAGRLWPPTTQNSLSSWKKGKINCLSPVDSFQFHFRPNLISNTHQTCWWNQILRKMLEMDKSTGVNRKMYQWEAEELWPGCAHPYRLWLDIWSQSQWNARWVMTGMVIGRLWLTSDLEVLKGHSSLNCLWADVLSEHEKVTEPSRNTRKVSPTTGVQSRFLGYSLLRQ